MGNPRILVSSIDPWSELNGSNTLSSLLSQFNSSDIASINIRSERSDSPIASRYFHILEERVIRSIFRPSVVTGEEYTASCIPNKESVIEMQAEKKRYSKRRLFGRWVYVIIREIIWKIGHWKSRALDSFVESVNPDVFFFPIENYIHFNRINRYIIEAFHPRRVVGYMWDDNFTFKQQPLNLLYLFHRIWLRKSVRWIVRHCDSVLAISPKMKEEVDSYFGIESVLLTKPICDNTSFVPYMPGNPIRILYTGKLIVGRDKTVAEIVKAIKIINADSKKVVLDVYSGSSISESMRRRIAVEGCCELHGFIPQNEVIAIQKKADILLFVESFSSFNTVARLSFSTKITDYLSSGKCIWAVGNGELAPIEYLRCEDAAIVSITKKDILDALYSVVKEPSIVSQYARKAHFCGVANHNEETIRNLFYRVIMGSSNV